MRAAAILLLLLAACAPAIKVRTTGAWMMGAGPDGLITGTGSVTIRPLGCIVMGAHTDSLWVRELPNGRWFPMRQGQFYCPRWATNPNTQTSVGVALNTWMLIPALATYFIVIGR